MQGKHLLCALQQCRGAGTIDFSCPPVGILSWSFLEMQFCRQEPADGPDLPACMAAAQLPGCHFVGCVEQLLVILHHSLRNRRMAVASGLSAYDCCRQHECTRVIKDFVQRACLRGDVMASAQAGA
jgi:hypothetical protein